MQNLAIGNGHIVGIENHRSRQRIKDFGEVFTSENYAQQMLLLLGDSVWSDDGVTFFEPSCGHGNIVLSILERRVSALLNKYQLEKSEKPILQAIANSIHTLWAVDICAQNVELTRKRIFEFVAHTLAGAELDFQTLATREFLAHVLCTIVWQVHENEVLSALSEASSAKNQGELTKLGSNWHRKNKVRKIDFSQGWCFFFQTSRRQRTVPILYQAAIKFVVQSIESKKLTASDEFLFAKNGIEFLLEKQTRQLKPRRVVL